MSASNFYKLYQMRGGQARAAMVETFNGTVIYATIEMSFAIGWPTEHLKAQAAKYKFRMTLLPRQSRTANFVNQRPTPAQRLAFGGTKGNR